MRKIKVDEKTKIRRYDQQKSIEHSDSSPQSFVQSGITLRPNLIANMLRVSLACHKNLLDIFLGEFHVSTFWQIIDSKLCIPYSERKLTNFLALTPCFMPFHI